MPAINGWAGFTIDCYPDRGLSLASTVLHLAAESIVSGLRSSRDTTASTIGNRDKTCRRASMLGAVVVKTIVFRSDNCAMRGEHRIRAATGLDSHRKRRGLDQEPAAGPATV